MFNAVQYASCCILALFVTISVCNDEGIDLQDATIRGLRASDGDYNMYLGIPYAKVKEKNYFGTSIPYKIKDVFEAYDDSIICPQLNEDNGTIMGSIDCLRLNIYVPEREGFSDNLRPVMIWIYGGRFEYGNAGRNKYGPSYLMQHDIILVTINYRTGPYGFMCLDMPEVSGNQGLKDQYLAIKWVKENIESFGGDPDQITLFGQSAGGHAIDLHLMSNKKILFQRVILQSGSAEALTALYEPDKTAPFKIARYIGFETTNMEEALDYLSRIDIKLVINAAIKLKIKFRPCVEAQFYNIVPFIATPWVIDGVPRVKNMSIMMGFNKLELAAKLYSNSDDLININDDLINDNLQRVFDFDQQVLETKYLVSNFYFGEENVSDKVKWGAIRFASDITYIHPIHRTLQRYLENNAGNIYFFMLSYVGGRNELRTTDYDEFDSNGNVCCASHNDDIAYLFNMASKPAPTVEDEEIIQRMTTMWTNFATYGNPTPETTELLPVIWKPISACKHYYLDINTDLSLRKRPLHERMAFWDLFFIHNKQSLKGYEEEDK